MELQLLSCSAPLDYSLAIPLQASLPMSRFDCADVLSQVEDLLIPQGKSGVDSGSSLSETHNHFITSSTILYASYMS